MCQNYNVFTQQMQLNPDNKKALALLLGLFHYKRLAPLRFA